MYFVYAEEYGCHPQDVPKVVSVEAWMRWLLWRKAKASREANENFGQPGAAVNLTPDQRELLSWAISEDY